jgi:hypothetical protein
MRNKNTEDNNFELVKQSLESYEEAYIEGSWEGFLQQRKKNKRKLFLRIAAGVAASLLFLFTGTNYFFFEKNKVSTTSVKQVSSLKSNTTEIEQSNTPKPDLAMAGQKSELKDTQSAVIPPKVNSGPKSTFVATAPKKAAALTVVPGTGEDSTIKSTGLTANREAKTGQKMQEAVKDSVVKPNSTTKEFFQGTVPATENQNLATTSKRKVRLGINFSPGMSTAQSSASFNYTGGLSADIPLSARFQLTTGLQVENQSIVKNIPGIVSSSGTPSNQEKTKVTNLDVPLNVTWKFFSEKSKAYYVSAGLSSLVYLWEQDKNTSYSQDLIPVSSLVSGEQILSYKVVNQVSVKQNNGTPDQTFDFAGRVNILVGFETKLTGKLMMHIEPYAKIPTSGQAPSNLNHTSTGINFKISF